MRAFLFERETMAAANAVPFPIRGQAFRALVSFRDTSGNLITTWNTPVAVLSKDGAATSSTASPPVEIGTSGMGYLELSATEMDASTVQVKCSVSNANQTATIIEITPLVAEPTGHALSQTIVRFEHLIYNLFQYWINRSTFDRSGNLKVYKADGETPALTGTHTNLDSVAEKTELA